MEPNSGSTRAQVKTEPQCVIKVKLSDTSSILLSQFQGSHIADVGMKSEDIKPDPIKLDDTINVRTAIKIEDDSSDSSSIRMLSDEESDPLTRSTINSITVYQQVDIMPKSGESDDKQESSPKESSSESGQTINLSSTTVSPHNKSKECHPADDEEEEPVSHSRRISSKRSLSTITTLTEGTDSDESSVDTPICALPLSKRKRPNPTISPKTKVQPINTKKQPSKVTGGPKTPQDPKKALKIANSKLRTLRSDLKIRTDKLKAVETTSKQTSQQLNTEREAFVLQTLWISAEEKKLKDEIILMKDKHRREIQTLTNSNQNQKEGYQEPEQLKHQLILKNQMIQSLKSQIQEKDRQLQTSEETILKLGTDLNAQNNRWATMANLFSGGAPGPDSTTTSAPTHTHTTERIP
ncbi:hypothetical protein UCRPC4_g05593 [Phaeomoniella chlamydospora]|uniref:Uncharacterized protein n=1 Tax=Phaeomoniella chlamydospora TaxID=158046 RepID=A0A0G2E551_PHACM|nr:hypothetical protein UCRPC4_g05593 [Phaeomoniella chlamydospora]